MQHCFARTSTARTVALWRSGLWAVTGKKDGGISQCRAVCISVLPSASMIAAALPQSKVAAYAFKHDGAWEIVCIPWQSLALISVFTCPLPWCYEWLLKQTSAGAQEPSTGLDYEAQVSPSPPPDHNRERNRKEKNMKRKSLLMFAITLETGLALWLDIFKSCKLSAEEVHGKTFSRNIFTDNQILYQDNEEPLFKRWHPDYRHERLCFPTSLLIITARMINDLGGNRRAEMGWEALSGVLLSSRIFNSSFQKHTLSCAQWDKSAFWGNM